MRLSFFAVSQRRAAVVRGISEAILWTNGVGAKGLEPLTPSV